MNFLESVANIVPQQPPEDEDEESPEEDNVDLDIEEVNQNEEENHNHQPNEAVAEDIDGDLGEPPEIMDAADPPPQDPPALFTIYDVPQCYVCHIAPSTLMASCGHLFLCVQCHDHHIEVADHSCPFCQAQQVNFSTLRGLLPAQMVQTGVILQVELPQCRACNLSVATYVANPCGHLAFCQGCQATHIQCTACEVATTGKVRLKGLSEAQNVVPRRMFEAPECLICKGYPSKVIVAPCGHLPFCHECLAIYLELGPSRCPLCRAEIIIYSEVLGLVHHGNRDQEEENIRVELPLCLACNQFTAQYVMTPCGHMGLCRACHNTEHQDYEAHCIQCDEFIVCWVRLIVDVA